MAKRFFYTAMGILALAAAYHLGAARTEAQGVGQFAGISTSDLKECTTAITSSGDVYARAGMPQRLNGCAVEWSCQAGEWAYIGNVLGGPVPTESQSFGSIKGQFK